MVRPNSYIQISLFPYEGKILPEKCLNYPCDCILKSSRSITGFPLEGVGPYAECKMLCSTIKFQKD